MAEISAKDVAALRKVTGAGMMDCKRALEETSGDVEAAKTWLREKGLAAAGKRSGRAAEQGAVEVIYDDGRGAIAEVTCETDFVAKGAEFRAAVAALARQVLDKGDGDLASQPYIDDPSQTIGGVITALASKLGENIGIGRIVRFESDGGIVDGYKHIQNERGTIGVLVELGGVAPADSRAREVAHDIALHIASAAPRWVRKDDVPDDVIAAERQVLENLTRNEGKPEAAISKIVDGRIQGFYKDSVLLEQPFVRDAKTTVGQLLGSLGGDASVVRVARVKVGEE